MTGPRLTLFLRPLALILAFGAGVAWHGCHPRSTAVEAQPAATPARAVSERTDLGSDELETIARFREAAPSVAYITSLAIQRLPFSMNLREIPRGAGTGFVWDDRGHIVTNYHVIQGASAAQVTLADQSTWDAVLVGFAPEKDLAVLRIEAPADRLRPIPLGRSHDLLVGQKVLAIGNPFGLDQTLTTGVISALGREIDSLAGIPIRDVVQTDAAINPGNSGGPLLDSAGRLIGVNTKIVSTSGAYAGIGFAIPVDTVNRVVPDLIAFGQVRRPTLGVESVNDATTRRLGLEGALIARVLPGSGAERAGIRGIERDRRGRPVLGDVIVAIDDQPVRSSRDLFVLLEERQIGERVKVTVLRGNRSVDIEIELGSSL
jgi:S1-C subfamily serine protease